MKKILILGAGTGGTIMANLLHKRLDKKQWSITVIDKNNAHYYQPGFLFIPFGLYTKEQITEEKSKFIPRGVEFILSEIERIDPQNNAVILKDGKRIPYDFLIVATGVEIMPDETPGLRDGWRDTIFDF
jgi:sulfide:quinone oxidoreductase